MYATFHFYNIRISDELRGSSHSSWIRSIKAELLELPLGRTRGVDGPWNDDVFEGGEI